MKAPYLQDALIHDGLLIFGGPHRGGFAAKGYLLEVPSISNADLSYLATMENSIRALLRSIDSECRLQMNWSTASDHKDVLLGYYERSEQRCRAEWSRRNRDERFVRYYRRQEAGALRCDRLSLYVSRPFTERASSDPRALAMRLSSMGQAFQPMESVIRELVSSLGGDFLMMGEKELAKEYSKFLNPYESGSLPFDPLLSVLENFQLGQGVGVEDPQVGFYLGGAYHGLVAFSSLPQSTCSGLIGYLTGLPIQDYSICVNVSALEITGEIAKAESEIGKLRNTSAHSDHARMGSAIAMKEERVRRLMTGSVIPLSFQFIVRAWDRNPDILHTKIAAVRSAMLRMKSAKPGEASFPTSALSLFRCSTPGWCWDKYPDFRHYIEDHNLANLLPVTGSSGQVLREAEALYDTPGGGLIGISGFAGEAGSESPQHMLVTGSTGSGKSLWLNDLLTQSDPHYDFTVIVDDGFSYGGYAQKHGVKSFIVEPSGELTLNYLDPQDALLPDHLADVCAVIAEMCGIAEPNRGQGTEAVISGAVDRFYRDVASDWLDRSESNLELVCREAILFERMTSMDATQGGWAAAWRRFSEWKLQQPDDYVSELQSVTIAEIQNFKSKEPAAETLFRLSFVHMDVDEAPRHSQLRNWLEVECMAGDADGEQLALVAKQLSEWCVEGGKYGAIFDGPNSVDLKSSLIHIELGRISEAASKLKRLVILVICNNIRNALMKRPRSQRKRVVLEEISALLNIPSSERVVRDLFERSRKHGVWMIAVLQTLRDRVDSPALISIAGNTRQAVFFKQTNPSEVEMLGDVFRLPRSAREVMLAMPSPSTDKGAMFVVCNNNGGRTVVSVGCNVVDREMLAVSGSSGAQYDARTNGAS